MINKLKEYEEFGVFLFPVVAMFVAPYVHEYIHVFFLNLFRCPSVHRISLTAYGIYGYIEPMCQLTKGQTFVMLMSPVIVNTIIGIFLFGLAFHLKPRKHPYIPISISSVGIGFIVSSALDFFSRNCDFKIAFESAQISVPNYVFPLIGVVAIAISSVLYLEVLFEISRVVRRRRPTKARRL